MTSKSAKGASQIELAAAFAELSELMKGIQDDQIKLDQHKKQAALEENLKKLQTAKDKLDRANQLGDTGPWQKARAWLNLAGAVLSLAAGTAMAALVPGAQFMGAMMITTSVCQVILAADAICAAYNDEGLGIAGLAVMKKTGDREKADKADMILRITVTAVAAVSALACMFSGGASSVGMARVVQGVCKAIEALTVATEGGMSVYLAFREHTASKYRIAEQVTRAESKDIEAQIKHMDAMIDMTLQELQKSFETANAILDRIMASMADTARTLNRV